MDKEWEEIINYQEIISKNYAVDDKTFRCFTFAKPQDIKIIIIGQDPYPTGGDGLAFSADKYKVANCTILSCLRRRGLLKLDRNYSKLDAWAQRGALLMNAMLTHSGDKKNLHKYWLEYTGRVIRYFADKDVKFLVWGKFAESITAGIVPPEKCFIYHHPTAKKGLWDCPHFELCDFDWSL